MIVLLCDVMAHNNINTLTKQFMLMVMTRISWDLIMNDPRYIRLCQFKDFGIKCIGFSIHVEPMVKINDEIKMTRSK